MNNVLKFDPEKKRKPEPEQQKPQNEAVRFVWISAIVGPLGSAFLLMALFGFSDIWAAITNPLVGGYWAQVGKLFGFAIILGVGAIPSRLGALVPYAMAVEKGFVLLQSIYVRRAVIAGGIYGVVVVLAMSYVVASGLGAFGLGQMAAGVAIGGVAGVMVSFFWAHVCWIIGGEKLSPRTNDNR